MNKSRVLTALAALAHETRLDILRLLVLRSPEGLSAGEIATRVNASASRLSFHLSALEQAGLLRALRDGRFLRYSVNHAHLGGVIGYLLNDCCKGHPEVCACSQPTSARREGQPGEIAED